jgi:UDP-3-O-[3-hydroxymyristoyl] glucosamine N-acyltransferase
MNITVAEIATMLGGEVEGDAQVAISAPAKIEEGLPGTLTFLANSKYEKYIYDTQASAVLVGRDFIPAKTVKPVLIRVDNVYDALAKLMQWYEQLQKSTEMDMDEDGSGIHESVKIAEGVKIGKFTVIEANTEIGSDTIIHSNVYISHNVKIGSNCLIYPGVRIMHETEMGDHCVVFPNAIIGSDGFGYARSDDGYARIPQIGKVIIGNHVEIGSNTVIDRATMGATIIHDGVKLDNLIQIAHNVEIGERTVIAAQTGIAGSAKIGQDCMIGGQVGIAGHLKLPDRTYIQAKSGVSAQIKEPGKKLFGYPAINYTNYLRSYNIFTKLPEMKRKVEELEREIKILKEKLS